MDFRKIEHQLYKAAVHLAARNEYLRCPALDRYCYNPPAGGAIICAGVYFKELEQVYDAVEYSTFVQLKAMMPVLRNTQLSPLSTMR